jgi:quercetin dioxygenase-like cupin family protein
MTPIDVKDLDVSHHFGAGVYAKETRIPARYVLVQHKHVYTHLSILACGTAMLSKGTQCIQITGPKVITVEANEHHRVEAITDCVWFCIHATHETDPDKVDDALISKGVP